MNKIQNEQWINALPDEAVTIAEEINIEIAKVIAERIKAIGELSPSDIKQLTNSLQYLGADFGRITKLIAKYSDKGQMAVVDTLKQVADGNDEFADVFYSANGIAAHTWRNDNYLHTLVEAMARQTIEEFTNLSQTLVYKIDDKTLSLRQMYTRAIDKAIYEVHSGTVDYHTAMRKTVKQLSNNMRILKWESGYTKRLDSHIRQNLIDGVKQLQTQMLDYHGEQFGSDGVEISAHALSAPDHVDVQGKQFSNEEFYKMQNGLDFVDVNGNKYKGFARPIGQWNCRHIRFPIIIGISQPVYTEKQLKEFAKNSEQNYDFTQQQRAMETRLRQLKAERLTVSAAGDELEAKRIQRKINEQQTIYRRFSEKHNLLYDTKRASVEGYRKISAKSIDISLEHLQSIANDDTINMPHNENIIKAMQYANGKLMIDTYGYKDISIQVANMVNQELTNCFEIFGDLKSKNVLRAIRVVPDDKFDSVAAYSPPLQEILLKKGIVGSSNATKKMLALSQKNYNFGFWSTGAAEHQIRHELGHAVEQIINSDKLDKIKQLRQNILSACGIVEWDMRDREQHKVSAQYISHYALKDDGEFIAESIAEYLNGNPRNTAKSVVDIILGVE